MFSRLDLETRIAARLAIISAENMQRLAEDYVRIRFPERFPRFDFRALSPEGKSRHGWPDAYVVHHDGTVDGVEATTEKGKESVRRHLEQDLLKACKRQPPLTGFVFVSAQPAIRLNDFELHSWRQRFVQEAGLLPSRVDFVFGGRLVQELALAEFASSRIEILGIPDLPEIFEPVRRDVRPNDSEAWFTPSPAEYEGGWVYRPTAADSVLEYLTLEGRVLLQGVGASGKTVLVWLLALEATRRGLPAYYLDLAAFDH